MEVGGVRDDARGNPDDAAHPTIDDACGDWLKEVLVRQSFFVDFTTYLDLGYFTEIFWWIDRCCTDQASHGTTRLGCLSHTLPFRTGVFASSTQRRAW